MAERKKRFAERMVPRRVPRRDMVRGWIGSAKDNAITLFPLVIAVLLTMSAALYFNATMQRDALRDAIRDIEPVFLLANFVLVVAAFAINLKPLREALSGIKPTTWILLLIILGAAFCLRYFVAPQTHRLFFDEDIYVELGQDILSRGKGALCNWGTRDTCVEYDLMKWPNGYPFLLAVTFLFTGINEAAAFDVSILIGTATVAAVFLAAYMLTKDEKVAVLAALLLALLPQHIMWSATTSTEPVMAFFSTLTAFLMLYAFERDDPRSRFLALMVFAYAIQLKSEGLLLLPIFGLMMLLLDRKLFRSLGDKRVFAIWCVMLVLIVPYLTHMKHAFDNDSWGADSGDKMGLHFIGTILPTNMGFWLNGYRTIEHPFLFTALAVMGGAYLMLRGTRKALFLGAWFFAFLLMYSSFYAGSVLYGVDVRYMLNCYPPFIILGAVGASSLCDLPSGILGRVKGRPAKVSEGKGGGRIVSRLSGLPVQRLASAAICMAVVIGIVASFYQILPTVMTPAANIEEARQARVYHDFAINVSRRLSPDCYILSHVPSIYLPMGKSSLQTWNGQDRVSMDRIFNETDCVVFDDGYWCNVDPYKTSVCKSMFDNYRLTVIETMTEPTGHVYTFYYVNRK